MKGDSETGCVIFGEGVFGRGVRNVKVYLEIGWLGVRVSRKVSLGKVEREGVGW